METSPFFKKPANKIQRRTDLNESSVSSVYERTSFFRPVNQLSSPSSNSDTSHTTHTTVHENLSQKEPSNFAFSSAASTSTFEAASSSSNPFSDTPFKRKGKRRISLDLSSTPLTTSRSQIGNNITTTINSSFFGEVNQGCFVAVLEGRGSARGEVGLASISLSNPTLILCQFSDTRTYARTLTKIAILNPSEIVTPNNPNTFGQADPTQAKLHDDIKARFPLANLAQVHRKYFNETRGLESVKHLCAKEYASVELQLQHKFYALAAASCLLKYVEFIENIIYAPKVCSKLK